MSSVRRLRFTERIGWRFSQCVRGSEGDRGKELIAGERRGGLGLASTLSMMMMGLGATTEGVGRPGARSAKRRWAAGFRRGPLASACGGVREVVLVRRPGARKWNAMVEAHERVCGELVEDWREGAGGLLVGAEVGEIGALRHGGAEEPWEACDYDFASVRSFASAEARVAGNARLPGGAPWAGAGVRTLGCVYVPRPVVPFPLMDDATPEAVRVLALVRFSEGSHRSDRRCEALVGEVVAAMERERPGALRGLEWGRQLGCGHGGDPRGSFADVQSPAYDFAVLSTVATEEDAHGLSLKLGGVPHLVPKEYGGGLRWMAMSYGTSSVCATFRADVTLPQPSALSLALRPALDRRIRQVADLYGTLSENDLTDASLGLDMAEVERAIQHRRSLTDLGADPNLLDSISESSPFD